MRQFAVDLNTLSSQDHHRKAKPPLRLSSHLAREQSPGLFLPSLALSSVYVSLAPSSNTPFLGYPSPVSHPPPTSYPSAPPLQSLSFLVKNNIYLSVFEFTHAYHWVGSPRLRGGLERDSLTLHWS